MHDLYWLKCSSQDINFSFFRYWILLFDTENIIELYQHFKFTYRLKMFELHRCVCVPNLWVHPVLELLNPLSSPLEDRWPMISITIRVSIYFHNYRTFVLSRIIATFQEVSNMSLLPFKTRMGFVETLGRQFIVTFRKPILCKLFCTNCYTI